MQTKIEHILAYKKNILSANKELTKKELFKDLLQKMYAQSQDILEVLTQMSLGSETTVINIPRHDKFHRGSIDTFYNNVIIEFENDLKKSEKHAKEQLSGYLLGKYNSGDGYNFTLIASDFITWKVFVLDISCIEYLDNLQEHEVILTEVKNSAFTLTDENAAEFYFWIDRFLFREEKEKATLERIERTFGFQNRIFIDSFRIMDAHYQDIKKYGEIQVSVEQWSKFLSIAYGSFDGSDSNFLIHSYLSVFAKLLAFGAISNDDYISDEKLYEILSGEAFITLNIENFVVDDFFHWTKSERSFKALTQVFRKIAQEISTFDFSKIDEDILKGVYQGLIDLDTRHSLGEYYTPDWLCERVVQEYDFKKNSRILDPSCGSGSFLRAAIARLKTLNPEISTDEIAKAVHGIDIHPLSVQIAKTTVLLALGKGVSKSNKPIKINIILANTLLAPDGAVELFGKSFRMTIDKQNLILNSKVFDDIILFDDAIHICDELANATIKSKKIDLKSFENSLRTIHKNGGLTSPIIDSFYKIYESFKIVKEEKRDTIWKFIVQNLYKPYFLANKFDFIVGNPPWFTFSSIKNETYQQTIKDLAGKHKVKTNEEGTFPHLEIAAIFLAYCSGYFLRENGKIAMVLPRSFFNAKQHENTRSGKAEGYKITNLWDLEKVTPLFNIPSCVIFGEQEFNPKNKKNNFNSLYFSGRLPKHNCHWEVAEPKLTIIPQTLHYAKQGKSSAFSVTKSNKNKKINLYKDAFKQGAILVPRTFYFVDIALENISPFEDDTAWKDRIIPLKTAEHVKADAKKPWKDVKLNAKVHTEFVFRTALSKNILPFVLFKPELVHLPIKINEIEGVKNIVLMNQDDFFLDGKHKTAMWFKDCENIWEINRTPLNKKYTATDYINYQNKLTSQNMNAPYLVIYTASAKDANATIVKRSDMALEFIVESCGYVFYTHNLTEAYFLTGYLNASKPNLLMKDFQAKGLFGPRHVHKKILDVYFPAFNANEKLHISLANWSEMAHAKAKEYVEKNPPTENIISAIALGKLRTNIKKHIALEMLEIDKLVEKLMEN